MADIAQKEVDRLQNIFINLNDNAYKMTTASGRKQVIMQMEEFIRDKKNHLQKIIEDINTMSKRDSDTLNKLNIDYKLGKISREIYKHYVDEIRKSTSIIILKQKYNDLLEEYKPLINDAYAIIRVINVVRFLCSIKMG